MSNVEKIMLVISFGTSIGMFIGSCLVTILSYIDKKKMDKGKGTK